MKELILLIGFGTMLIFTAIWIVKRVEKKQHEQEVEDFKTYQSLLTYQYKLYIILSKEILIGVTYDNK